MRKGISQHVESELYNYHQTLYEINKIRKNIIYGTPTYERIGGRSNIPPDPTLKKVTTLATYQALKQMEKVTEAIESVYCSIHEDKQELIRLKYWGEKRVSWEKVSQDLCISLRTAYNWRDEIVKKIAEELNWNY